MEWCPVKNFKALSCTISDHVLEAKALARQRQYHQSIWSQGCLDMKWELLLSGTAPHVFTLCLPDITAHDQISQAFPLRIQIRRGNNHVFDRASM